MRSRLVLVTGGAGYIGSHTVRALKNSGFGVLILDNMINGHREAVKGFKIIEGNLADVELLDKVFSENDISAVIHFAGYIEAGESMQHPHKFFSNNITNGINLLGAMLKYGVKDIVFSSSAAVYGEPEVIPITEKAVKNPTNYYGLTKLMFEQILESYSKAYDFRFAALRYFNASGSDPSGSIGEDHDPETHLIPLILKTALGQRSEINIYGTDYNTPDGTCIRDYVHVCDLADAHVLSLKYLFDKRDCITINLGTKRGYSVREVIEAAKKITGINFKVVERARRSGDPERLVASSDRAKRILNWEPKFSIYDSISSAWTWYKENPHGFDK